MMWNPPSEILNKIWDFESFS